MTLCNKTDQILAQDLKRSSSTTFKWKACYHQLQCLWQHHILLMIRAVRWCNLIIRQIYGWFIEQFHTVWLLQSIIPLPRTFRFEMKGEGRTNTPWTTQLYSTWPMGRNTFHKVTQTSIYVRPIIHPQESHVKKLITLNRIAIRIHVFDIQLIPISAYLSIVLCLRI